MTESMVVQVGFDSSTWVEIPRAWPHDGCAGPRRWVRKIIRDVTHRSETVTRAQHRYLTTVLTYLSSFGVEDELRFVHLPDVMSNAALVRVQFGAIDGSRDKTLRMLASSTDMQPLEPPQVAPFTAEQMGEGYRAIHSTVMPNLEPAGVGVRHRGSDIVTVWATYAFRKGPYDLRISCPADSVVELLGLLPVLDALVHGIDVVPAAS